MVFSREFKHNFGKMIAWVIVIAILTGLLLMLYPMMLERNMKSMFDEFVSSLGPRLSSILGVKKDLDYSNLSQYMAFIFQYLSILIAIFAMQLGAGSLSREQGNGAIQYFYSNPISRVEIVTQKILSNILTFIIFLVALSLIIFGILNVNPLRDAMINQNIAINDILIDYLKIIGSVFASSLVYMSIGYFFSSIAKTSFLADGTSVLFVVLTIIVEMAGKFVGNLFEYIISMFPLEVFNPINILLGNIDLLSAGINLIIFIVFILLTYSIYISKEIDYL